MKSCEAYEVVDSHYSPRPKDTQHVAVAAAEEEEETKKNPFAGLL